MRFVVAKFFFSEFNDVKGIYTHSRSHAHTYATDGEQYNMFVQLVF